MFSVFCRPGRGFLFLKRSYEFFLDSEQHKGQCHGSSMEIHFVHISTSAERSITLGSYWRKMGLPDAYPNNRPQIRLVPTFGCI
jgi:hypothetical protein